MHGSCRSRVGSVLAAGCLAAALVGSATAGASVRVDVPAATPVTSASACSTTSSVTTTLQAGARADFCLALRLDGGRGEVGDIAGFGDDARALTISLPPGQIGNPGAADLCSLTRFRSASGCPGNAKVGEVTARADAVGVSVGERLLSGSVYLVTPSGTEAVQLGVTLGLTGTPPSASLVKILAQVRLRAADGGLNARIDDLPRSLFGLPIEIRRLNLRLWGSPGDHPTLRSPFMTTPTTCTPAVTRISVTSYAGDVTAGETSFVPTGCGAVPFAPELIAEGERAADAPIEFTAGVRMPVGDDQPLAQSHVTEARVILPDGIELSATSGNRLSDPGCTDEEFDARGGGPVSCPALSAIGTAQMASPLLAPLGGRLAGTIYLAQPRPGKALIRLFVLAEAGPESDALRVKLTGDIIPDPQTGRLTAILQGLPPLPFTEFRLTFRGGEAGIVSSPRACGTYEAVGGITPDSGGAVARPSAPVVFDQGCGDPAAFTPEMTLSTSPTNAASPTSLTARFVRPQGNARLAALDLNLPAGLIGRLTAAAQCPLAQAAAGTCGPESLIGSVVASSGPGPKPFVIDGGQVFLTEGANGALAGISIKIAVRIGPLDLGTLIVGGAILVRPDIGLTLRVDQIPQRLPIGVATAIRDLTVTLDRPGFMLNGTSCMAATAVASIRSDLGTLASPESVYQPTGCAGLPYEPRLTTSFGGGAKQIAEGGHPSLDVTLTQSGQQGNTRKVELTLPSTVSADVTRLRNACPEERYLQDACDPKSVVGTATAATPLLAGELSGPVTFVSRKGTPLPGLAIRLSGPISVDLTAAISLTKDNRLTTVIDNIPDVPLSRFQLRLDAGPKSPLIANRDMCASAAVVNGAAEAHSGGRIVIDQQALFDGCGPTATLRVGSLRGGRPSLDLRIVGGRTRVRTVQFVMPRGVEFQRASVVKRRLKVSASGLKKGTRARVTVTGHSIRVTIPRNRSAKVLRIRLKRGGLRASTRLRRRGRPRLSFSLTTSARELGTRTTKRSRVKVRARPAKWSTR